MFKRILPVFFIVPSLHLFSQSLEKLTVEKIMRDTKWIGTSPSNPYWSIDGKYLFFSWNPEQAVSDSIYYINPTDLAPRKAGTDLRTNTLTTHDVKYNASRSAYTYSKWGDIFFSDLKTNKPRRVTQTSEAETDPSFIQNDTKIVYSSNLNLFVWDISSGTTTQLVNFQRGSPPLKKRKK